MEVVGHRKIGRPKLTWSDVIRKHMQEKQVNILYTRYIMCSTCLRRLAWLVPLETVVSYL